MTTVKGQETCDEREQSMTWNKGLQLKLNQGYCRYAFPLASRTPQVTFIESFNLCSRNIKINLTASGYTTHVPCHQTGLCVTPDLTVAGVCNSSGFTPRCPSDVTKPWVSGRRVLK